jgi:SOS-response transcriptional repressor LexA
MLALMAEIARSPDGRFSTPSVATATLSTSTIHALLKRLKQLGLVRRTDEVTPERIRIYQRAVHPTWDYALRLEEADARSRNFHHPVGSNDGASLVDAHEGPRMPNQYGILPL